MCVYLRAFLRLDHSGAAHCKKNIRSWGVGVNKCHWQGGRNPDGVAWPHRSPSKSADMLWENWTLVAPSSLWGHEQRSRIARENRLLSQSHLLKIFFFLMSYFSDEMFRHNIFCATDYGRQMKPFFSSKSQTFGLGQTIWADKFWGICGIFCQFINTHFGTVFPLPMFSINQPIFLQKTKPQYPNPKYSFWIGIWIWAAKNFGI